MTHEQGLLPILDGHNDVISELLDAERAARSSDLNGDAQYVRNFFERGPTKDGHIDLPRAREGGFAGGLFSIYVSADPQAAPPAGPVLGQRDGLKIKFPRPLELGYAQRVALAELGILHRLQRDSTGQVRVVRTIEELRQCVRDGVLAAVIHFEGAEPIDPGLDALEFFYAAGL